MNNMKKKLLVLITIFALLVPFIVNASNKNVKSIDATILDGTIHIDGTTDDGVLAVAIMVYDKDERELIKLVTSPVDEDDKFEESIVVSKDDTYVVKAANYDGGEYISITVGEVKIESKYNVVAASSSKEDKKAAELTNDLVEKIVKGKTVKGIDKELKAKILKAVDDDKDIKVDLVKTEVKESEIKSDARLINKETNKNTIVLGYYDIDITVTIDNEVVGNITILDKEIELSIKLPSDIEKVKEGYTRNYIVYRLHDGEIEKLNANLDGDNVVFKTDKFSTYALAYEDIANPKTIDNVVTYIILGALAIIGIVGSLIYFKH